MLESPDIGWFYKLICYFICLLNFLSFQVSVEHAYYILAGMKPMLVKNGGA